MRQMDSEVSNLRSFGQKLKWVMGKEMDWQNGLKERIDKFMGTGLWDLLETCWKQK